MSNTNGMFMRQVDTFLIKTNLSIRQATRAVAIKVYDRVTERTPVDTGRARASWRLTAGSSPDLSVEPERPRSGRKEPFKSPPPLASFAAHPVGRVPAANEYVISNNLDYIQYLEEGSSKQAPAGMVKLAVADVRLLAKIKTMS